MIIGILRLELLIQGSTSLKAKRQVLKSLKERLKNAFNISVAEVEDQDKWQKATIGVAYLGCDKRSVNSALDKVLNFVETVHDVDLTNYDMEIL